MSFAGTPLTENETEGIEVVVGKLKGQLALALSILASMGFDVVDLTDYLT